jgi:hypothetical protein
MNIRLLTNKLLGSGLWWQLLFYFIVNVIVFSICLTLYFNLGSPVDVNQSIGSDNQQLGLWENLRLFVNSGGIIDHTHSFTIPNIILLITECLGTILFSGLIVSIITNVITQKVDNVNEGRVHYKLKNHVVIIGYDTIVPSIISEFIKSPEYLKSKIVLQSSVPANEIKNDLLSKLSEKDLKRVIIVFAPRQSVEELELLYTANAKDIYIVGDRSQSDHDAENMYTFETLVNIHEKQGIAERKTMTIWFEIEASYAALQLNDISDRWKMYFEFRPYNFYKRWANRLLTNSVYGEGDNKIVYPELDHEGISQTSKKHIHLIIVGMNRMGTALAKEAAHMMHFPNFNEKTGENRTRITFIDDRADVEMNFFTGKYAGYFDIAPIKYADLSAKKFEGFEKLGNSKNEEHFLDIQFEFIKGRIESEYVRDWIRTELKNDDEIITIAICLHNPSQSFGMAMYLPNEVYTRGRDSIEEPWEIVDKNKVVNIFVRQEKTGSLIKSFGDSAKSKSAKNKKYANIYPFGMIDDSFSINYHSNILAMAFNYIYWYYYKHDKTLPKSFPENNELLEKWKPIPTANKWSNLYLADSIEFKLRSIGYTLETIKNATLTTHQIDTMAETEHSRWNMEKLLLGYRPISEEEKNSNANITNLKDKMFAHSLIKPYADLTDNEKQLDKNIIKMLPDIIKILN